MNKNYIDTLPRPDVSELVRELSDAALSEIVARGCLPGVSRVAKKSKRNKRARRIVVPELENPAEE